MKKVISIILAIVSTGLAVGALYLIVTAPVEPPQEVRFRMAPEDYAVLVAPIDHAYRISAYLITWAIQLGYLGRIAAKWCSAKS